MDDDLRVGPQLTVPVDEVTWRFTPSGGPGGQHANRSNTRVEAVLNLESCTGPTESQRRRLIAKHGPELRIVVDQTRSQTRNRSIAVDRLVAQLRAGLERPKPRRATKPTQGSKRRRLENKRQRSETKARRQRPGRDD